MTFWLKLKLSAIRGAEASHQGSRIKDLGPCFGMNGHLRRDTDVISRQSKALDRFHIQIHDQNDGL